MRSHSHAHHAGRRSEEWRKRNAKLFHDELETQLEATLASLPPRIQLELSPLEVPSIRLEEELTRDITALIQRKLAGLPDPQEASDERALDADASAELRRNLPE